MMVVVALLPHPLLLLFPVPSSAPEGSGCMDLMTHES